MDEIPLNKPDIGSAEIDAVTNVLHTKKLSQGPRQDLFEQLVAEHCKRRYGAAVTSTCAALHLIFAALGIGPGDQVITTPFANISSANSILISGATPVFVDICPQSLNLDPKRIEEAITPNTKAIIATHTFGNPQHIEQIERIAQAHEIILIENASEGFGGTCNKRAVGSFGRAAIFDFGCASQVTTGEGAMIVTDDDKLYELACSMRNQGQKKNEKENYGNTLTFASSASYQTSFNYLGYGYKINEMACALGIAQIERIDDLLEKRRLIMDYYMRLLIEFEDLILPTIKEQGNGNISWFSFVVRLTEQYGKVERNRILQGMHRHEVGAADYYPCIHLQPLYKNKFGYKKGAFPIAETISERTIALPFYTGLDETHIELITHTLKVMLDRERLLKSGQ